MLLFLLITFAYSSDNPIISKTDLTLKDAIDIVERENLEIRIAEYQSQIKEFEAKVASGNSWGKADLSVTGMRSNDPGNVFGFKLQSREATFGDFGFDEFLTQMPALLGGTSGADERLLATQPDKLNNPDARDHYITKVSYQLPLYTGGMLTQYEKITKALYSMSKLDKDQILSEKIYQTKKSFYDISLIQSHITNLKKIEENIEKLENIVNMMITEGYAKKVDLLEVQAKRASVTRMLNQAMFNRDLAYQFLSFLLNQETKSIVEIYECAPMPEISSEEMLLGNIDIQKAQKGYEITKMAIELEKASFLPTVGAFAEYGSADNQLMGEFSDHAAYTVGVQAKWNLFNGAIDKNRYEKALTENLKVKNQVELAKKGIALEIAKIKTEIKSLDYEIKSLNKELEFAKEVYDNYLGRYSEKLVSINDVIIKQSIQIEQTLMLQNAKNKRNAKVFSLEKISNGVKK